MDIVSKTLNEIDKETDQVTAYLQGWWSTLGTNEKLFSIGVICAAFLLIAIVSNSRKPPEITYDGQASMSISKQFIFAAVILIIFTLGLDTLVDNVT